METANGAVAFFKAFDRPNLRVRSTQLDFLKHETPAVRRRREFHAGRECAGLESVGVGPAGEPLWPNSVVGSITHDAGVVVAVVGAKSDFRGIGIDAVCTSSPLRRSIDVNIFATQEELAHVSTSELGMDRLGLLLFSIKESIYKYQFPLTGRALHFHDVDVSALDFTHGTFCARIASERSSLSGHFRY